MAKSTLTIVPPTCHLDYFLKPNRPSTSLTFLAARSEKVPGPSDRAEDSTHISKATTLIVRPRASSASEGQPIVFSTWLHPMESLESLRVCNYSAIVALTFTLHDWISTAEEEVKQIWTCRRPWTNLKSLYIFIRTLSIGAQLAAVIITLQLPSNSSAHMSIPYCRGITGFQGVSSLILMIAVQAILLLRVEALYQRKTRLQLLLRTLYIGEIISTATIFAIVMPQIKYGALCLVTDFPTSFLVSFFLLPIIVELTFFVFTMIKFYEAVRDGWARQPLIFRFLQDGIWAFALPFLILIINTLCIALLPGPYSSIAYSWLIAIPGFAGCRLILNMSHLLKRHPEGPLTYPDQNFHLDTELLSHQDATTSGSPLSYPISES